MDVRALVAVPLVGALLTALDPSRPRRQAWLIVAAALHLVLLAVAWAGRLPGADLLWLGFDPLGGLVLTLVSVVFLAVAVYSVGYGRAGVAAGARVYETCLLGFLA